MEEIRIIDFFMNFRKEDSYFRHVRDDLLKCIPEKSKIGRVLDVGCGDGSTASYIKQKFNAKEVIGIEKNSSLKNIAEQHLDRFIIGDIGAIDLPFEQNYFDLIILADILEHLYDPWNVLKKLYPFLKENGTILSSIPNVQHWSILFNLLKGRWDYKSVGILDNTHIRFFTRKSIEEMFLKNDFKIEEITSSVGKEIRFLNAFTLGIFSGFFTYRYFVAAKKQRCPEGNNQ